MKFPDHTGDLREGFRQLLAWCRANRILGINGVAGQSSPNGTWLTLKIAAGEAGEALSTGSYIPWAPTFFTEGTDESPVYKCRFNLGTLNNTAAGNWDEDHTLPSDDTVKFVMLTITNSDGKVTGMGISLESDAPTEDVVHEDTPPSEWKILLGAVDKTSGMMIETTNLTAVAVEVYQKSKVLVTAGGEPFSRFWRWRHSAV